MKSINGVNTLKLMRRKKLSFIRGKNPILGKFHVHNIISLLYQFTSIPASKYSKREEWKNGAKMWMYVWNFLSRYAKIESSRGLQECVKLTSSTNEWTINLGKNFSRHLPNVSDFFLFFMCVPFSICDNLICYNICSFKL